VKDRRTIVEILRGGRPAAYRYDREAERHLAFLGLSARAQAQVRAAIPREQAVDEAQLAHLLDGPLARLGPRQREQVREALAVAAYLADPDWPVVRTLVCDDAPQFRAITPGAGAVLDPRRPPLQAVDAVPAPTARRPRRHPRPVLDLLSRAAGLTASTPPPTSGPAWMPASTRCSAPPPANTALDERLALTRDKKPELLLVLEHPELPLHNNPAELGARQRVPQARRQLRPPQSGPARRLGYLHDPGCHHPQARPRLRRLPHRPLHPGRPDPAAP